ncbi:MAG: M1 family aminopeptidase [Pseudomonadota bacterium]
MSPTLVTLAALVCFAAPPVPAPPPSSAVGRTLLPADLAPVEAPRELVTWLRTVEALKKEADLRRAEPVPVKYDNTDLGNLDLRTLDVSVQVSPDLPELIWVEARVEILVIEDGVGEIQLRLDPFDIFRCDDADGAPLVCEWISNYYGKILRVTPPEPLLSGETFFIDLGYTGSLACEVEFLLPPCGFGPDRIFVTHSDYYPTRPGAYDPFTGVLRVSVVGDLSVGATGTFVGKVPWEDGDGDTWVFEHLFEGFHMSFSVADFTRVEGVVEDLDLPISVFVTGEHVANAGAILAVMEDVLTFYSETFSPFPWNKLDAVELPDSFSGGYGPLSTIMVAQGIFGVPPTEGGFWSVVSLFSHEIAHQWWGNFVAPGGMDSVWLSEGFAEFSSKLHGEVWSGSRWGFVQNGMSYSYGVPQADDNAISDPLVVVNPNYFNIVYNKGSFVLDMLRHEIGEEAFFEAFHVYTDAYGEDLATVDEFQAIVEGIVDEDLAWFFDQWLHGTGVPRAAVNLVREERTEGTRLRLTVTQAVDSWFRFTLPLKVHCREGAAEEHRIFVDASDFEAEFVACPTQVVRVDPDPDRRLLRRFNTGGSADVNLDGEADAADLLDMAWYFGHDIVFTNQNGNSWFYPNWGYRDLADLNGSTPEKPDGLVDMLDVDLLVALIELADPR